MSVHHLLYVVFPIGFQPNLTKQTKFFEEFDFKFLPSGYSYFLDGNKLEEGEGEHVINSTDHLLSLSSELGIKLIQYWQGNDDVGFTLGYVQTGERVIGIFQFLLSEIELIHAYLRERGASLASFMCEFYSRMGSEVIWGGSDHGLLFSDLLMYVNSQLDLLPKEVGFFLIKEDSEHIPNPQNHIKAITMDGKKIYINWPFCE